MIYLVGGAPRCGKTTFSKRLAFQNRIPWVSTDLLREVARAFVPEQEWSVRLPEFNLASAPEEILKAEILEAKTLWPGTKRFIYSLLKWKHDYVIEGVHLLPDLVQELLEIDQGEGWSAMYLVKTDVADVLHGFEKTSKEEDWLLRDLKTPEELERAARMVQVKSSYLKDEAGKHGYEVIDTGADFQGSVESLLRRFAPLDAQGIAG